MHMYMLVFTTYTHGDVGLYNECTWRCWSLQRMHMEMLVFTMYAHIISIYMQVDLGNLIFQLHVYSKLYYSLHMFLLLSFILIINNSQIGLSIVTVLITTIFKSISLNTLLVILLS